MEEVLSGVKNIHLIGIGGAGMSGLALLLKGKGIRVKGSDIKRSPTTALLKAEGVEVAIGHREGNVAMDVQLLSYSSAVKRDNPEIREAKRRGIPILKRGELLALISLDKKTIAVAGSHGKTTVTSLIGYLLTSLDYQPTVFVGGLPLNYSLGAWWGKDYFVIETDESDGSFLEFKPWVSIITNIDYEHLDYYKGIDNLEKDFLKFSQQTKEVVLGCGDDARVRNIISKAEGLTYGFNPANKIKGRNFSFNGNFSCFDLFIDKKYIEKVKIPLLGEYNILNVLAALSFFFHIGEKLEKVVDLLKDFKGTRRRFQIKESVRGTTFVDDYAHHPTEIKNVLKAARNLKTRRLFVIFEPHRFSRIKLLHNQFSRSFAEADELIVTDICTAHEKEIKGINGEFVYEKIKEKFPKPIRYIPKSKLVEQVSAHIEEGDLVIGLGAGDINILMDGIVDEFKKRFLNESKTLQKSLVKTNVSLKDFTTIKIGGVAKHFIILHSAKDLEQIQKDFSASFYILGGGSNLLIKEHLIEEPIVKLGKEFDYIKEDSGYLEVGAATQFSSLIGYCLKNKLSGLQNLVGIPATVGGMLVMNASSFGKEISSYFAKVEIIDKGRIKQLEKKDISFGYRTSSLKGKPILRVWFRLIPTQDNLGEKANEFLEKKKITQELFFPTCGCIFKNPPDLNAAKLIEDCGFKGVSKDKALVSEKHANFIVNLGNATYDDVDYLIQKIKEKVQDKYGIVLEEEIERWG